MHCTKLRSTRLKFTLLYLRIYKTLNCIIYYCNLLYLLTHNTLQSTGQIFCLSLLYYFNRVLGSLVQCILLNINKCVRVRLNVVNCSSLFSVIYYSFVSVVKCSALYTIKLGTEQCTLVHCSVLQSAW